MVRFRYEQDDESKHDPGPDKKSIKRPAPGKVRSASKTTQTQPACALTTDHEAYWLMKPPIIGPISGPRNGLAVYIIIGA